MVVPYVQVRRKRSLWCPDQPVRTKRRCLWCPDQPDPRPDPNPNPSPSPNPNPLGGIIRLGGLLKTIDTGHPFLCRSLY